MSTIASFNTDKTERTEGGLSWSVNHGKLYYRHEGGYRGWLVKAIQTVGQLVRACQTWQTKSMTGRGKHRGGSRPSATGLTYDEGTKGEVVLTGAACTSASIHYQ